MGDEYVPFYLRQKYAERAGQPVIYLYDQLPTKFRRQAYLVLVDAIGQQPRGIQSRHVDGGGELDPNFFGTLIWRFVADELGLTTSRSGSLVDFHNFVTQESSHNVDEALTAIEIAFRMLTNLPEYYQDKFHCLLSADEAISKLNRRFRENDLGYAFEVDRIIRVDSQYAHTEIIEPALQLLADANFMGAQKLFLTAHEHFKQGKNEETIMSAGRAFETALKHICDTMGWKVSATPQASELIRVVSENGLFPTWHQNQLNSLGTLLTALPTARNKEAGHARTSVQEAPDDVAKLALHLCATNIVFAVEAYNRLKMEQEGYSADT